MLLFVEIYETIDFTIYFFNILRFSKKSLEVPKIKENEYPEVDVFIATINESEELLSRTIEGCLNMKYPDKGKVHIYLCDDGNRLNIKTLARKYNINYITRKDNKGAKAGNYNNALKHSRSSLIATFDADMCPTENFANMTFDIVEDDKGVKNIDLYYTNSFVDTEVTTPIKPKSNIANVNTLDNIFKYIGIFAFSLITVIMSLVFYKRNKKA